MLDCPESDRLAQFVAQSDATDASSPSAIEEKVVGLFDEIRVPLMRYLSAFPLPLSDAEDVIQEAFLSLFQQIQRRKSHHNIRGWLFRAAHHLAIKRRLQSRNEAEKTASLNAIEGVLMDPALNPEDEFMCNQRQTRLMSVVRALPEQHRWCLYLRAEGLRYREISEILDMSLGAVSISLVRSLAHIACALER